MAVYTYRKDGALTRVWAASIVDAFVLALDHLRSGDAAPVSIEDDGIVFDEGAIFRVYRHVP